MKTITIFGADGRVGKQAVRQAAERGLKVKAIMHEGGDHPHEAVEVLQANVLEDDLTEAVKGADAVLSCLGVGNAPWTLASPPPLYTEGTLHIATAMKKAGIDRLIVISASFIETYERGPLHFRAVLPSLTLIFKQMEQMEAQLARQSDAIRWTAVRPGWIMEGYPSPDALVSDGVIPEDLIRSRTGDIARLMLDCAMEGSWIHGTPAIASPEDDEATSIKAVAEEII